MREQTLEELMYKPDGRICPACETKWNDTSAAAAGRPCPRCGSTESELSYPEIPWLDEDLQVVYDSEARIARDERGVHLDDCLDSWLRRHGVTDPTEQWKWEEMFAAIASEHRAVNAERMEALREESNGGRGNND